MGASGTNSNGASLQDADAGSSVGVRQAQGASPPGSPPLRSDVRSDAPTIGTISPPPPQPLVTPVLEQLPVTLEAPVGAQQEAFEHGRVYLALKRALDVVVGSLALVALSPLFAVVAALIKLESPGPVFFFQTRVGKGGRHFRFWKFRSMVVDAEERKASLKAIEPRDAVSDRLRFKMQDDPRVTRTGRVLRRFSLDELPQLWNVVRGDMTLVGPRPPIPEEVAEYGPRHLRRLEVEQGITCLWQVSGRNLLSFEQQVELDIEYARRRTLALDVLLLLRTVPAVLTGRGAC
jgi:lipopolysaccharide/colanic/teichoic acid biosynthesis glycosyltransferase